MSILRVLNETRTH